MGAARHGLLLFHEGYTRKDSDNNIEGRNQETGARDFTYIDDLVKGCLAALDTVEKSTGSGGTKKGKAELRVFNLGNTSPVTVKKLVRTLERLLKVKVEKKVQPLPVNGDISFTHADISYAKRELGYRPKTDLESGLKKFVDWYLGYYELGTGRSCVLDNF